MTHRWTVPQADEDELVRLAERIALKLRAGDAVALSGDLGAGKTTFARALIRALLDDRGAEVPSPTFSLVQTYETDRLAVAHLDLYRIAGEGDVAELGVEEARSGGAIIVEWPERAPSLLGPDRLMVRLLEGEHDDTRRIELTGEGGWASRLSRVEALTRFLDGQPGWETAHVRYLQGDASARAYARIGGGAAPALLMDWPRQPDGPPIRNGLPYSRIAHLAEDALAFVAVDGLLRRNGFCAPKIHACDLDAGFLVIEDLGERVFGREVAAGARLEDLWSAATDVLVALRGLRKAAAAPLPAGEGREHRIPTYDRGALAIETELLLDWFWPMAMERPLPAVARDDFVTRWSPHLEEIAAGEPFLVLRDYHSPNLILLANGGVPARQRVGLIDFQDAVLGHPAYDLVSLLQDARLDVPEAVERDMLGRYVAEVSAQEPGFDEAAFRLAYAVLGAQRNTKILGIFARLAKRDGKRAYLAHIPRISRYLERNLAHSRLGALRTWYDTHMPAARRATVEA